MPAMLAHPNEARDNDTAKHSIPTEQLQIPNSSVDTRVYLTPDDGPDTGKRLPALHPPTNEQAAVSG